MQLPQLLLDDFITLIWTAQQTLKAGELPLGDKLGPFRKIIEIVFYRERKSLANKKVS